jgi:Type III secretion system YscX (type_III_YscX)
MKRIGDDRNLLAFDYGLAGVGYATDAPGLPEDGAAPAMDTQPSLQLEALFSSPSADDILQAASIPDVSDRRVLEPASYAAALDDARRLMLELANSEAGERRAAFADALAVLEGADTDRAVLDTARRALLRG